MGECQVTVTRRRGRGGAGTSSEPSDEPIAQAAAQRPEGVEERRRGPRRRRRREDRAAGRGAPSSSGSTRSVSSTSSPSTRARVVVGSPHGHDHVAAPASPARLDVRPRARTPRPGAVRSAVTCAGSRLSAQGADARTGDQGDPGARPPRAATGRAGRRSRRASGRPRRTGRCGAPTSPRWSARSASACAGTKRLRATGPDRSVHSAPLRTQPARAPGLIGRIEKSPGVPRDHRVAGRREISSPRRVPVKVDRARRARSSLRRSRRWRHAGSSGGTRCPAQPERHRGAVLAQPSDRARAGAEDPVGGLVDLGVELHVVRDRGGPDDLGRRGQAARGLVDDLEAVDVAKDPGGARHRARVEELGEVGVVQRVADVHGAVIVAPSADIVRPSSTDGVRRRPSSRRARRRAPTARRRSRGSRGGRG